MRQLTGVARALDEVGDRRCIARWIPQHVAIVNAGMNKLGVRRRPVDRPAQA